MRYLYSARLVPIGQPVTIPDDHGQPGQYTFDEHSFAIQRTCPGNIKVCLHHDRGKEIGKLGALIAHDGWWQADFTLDPALRNELAVGQPVSVGLSILPVGSGAPILSEVSIVRTSAVDGARITRRHELKPKPVTPRRSTPAPAAPAPVIRRSAPPAPRITPDAELDEYLRRMAWYGETVRAEVIIENMLAELQASRRGR